MLFLRIRSSYFSSFSEVACKSLSVLRFRFLFSFVTFPQLSFFCQLTISYVFYCCYYSLVDENQVQLLYSPVSANFQAMSFCQSLLLVFILFYLLADSFFSSRF